MLAIDNKYNIGEEVATMRSIQQFAIGLRDDIPTHQVERIVIREGGELSYTVHCSPFLDDDLVRADDIKSVVINLLKGRLYQLGRQWGVA